ncbi:hypothetical protein [Burkholderia pseudomallei]|uniref:hypothetical protein n=1 Tax=Burkholderia pseudomallei TaxID=28450 RepID=UPI0015C2D1EC|nr:hypothetical protein [Burkholderia pseudomallei]
MTFEIRRCIAPPSRAKRKSRTARLAALIAIRQDETHVDRWNAAEPASRCFAGLACRIRTGSPNPNPRTFDCPKRESPDRITQPGLSFASVPLARGEDAPAVYSTCGARPADSL